MGRNSKPISQMTKEELRAYKTAARREQRKAKKVKDKIAGRDSKAEPVYPFYLASKKRNTESFLRDIGVQHPHVIDTICDLADVNKIPVTALKLEPSWSNELVEGEPIYRADLEALRQISCPNTPEAEFRESRYRCKTDHFFLGNVALERPNTFCEQPHRAWVEEILVKKTPTLKPNYRQADIGQWFKEQTKGIPNRSLLMCSRQSQKSTVQIIDGLQFLLCLNGDVRLMQISAIKDLARKFTKFFRFYLTVEDPLNRTRFAQWFPEQVISASAKTDSNSFHSPMAHLGLGPSMVATSMDASQTGSRFDVGYFDDCADEENENTAALRVGLVEKYDSINKLRAEYGVTLTIGTPQSADQSPSEGDLYAVILARSSQYSHEYLRYRMDPAFKLKEEFVGASPYEVVNNPHMIESLLFPGKLDLPFLKEELATSSEKSFRRQYLLEWTDALAEEEKLQFDRNVLQALVIHDSVTPKDGTIYASADFGFSLERHRDPTVYSIARVCKDEVFFLDQVSGRWRDSDKAQRVIDLTKKYSIQKWFMEAFVNYERLADDIRQLAFRQGVNVDIYWDQPKNVAHRKFHLLKSLEIPIARGRIHFVTGILGTSSAWQEILFDQMEKLDGTKPDRKSSSIHDDLTEGISLLCKFFRLNPDDPSSTEEEERQEKELEAARLRANYRRVFGDQSDISPQPSTIPDNYTSQQESPIHRALAKGNFLKPPVKGAFAYMLEKPHR